ncbi:MAG: DsbA family protein [Acidimicrobiales bacterium]|nr:DsbA family protein [Acidimicrobiales bacterium]
MEARCWSDYLCPWCYVGSTRDPIFERHGIDVTHLPFELHPEIPVEGRRIRPDGRLKSTFDRIEAECSAAGIPFRRPTRMPNTRRVLAAAEWVRTHHPASFPRVHARLFAAHFANGQAIDDPMVLDGIVGDAGVDPAEVNDALESGAADALVTESMRTARDLGISSTPTWVVGELQIPGALDSETLERWLSRIAARTSDA